MKYDELQWTGMVCDLNEENCEAQIKFMHPSYPSRSYNWPSRNDICWIPVDYRKISFFFTSVILYIFLVKIITKLLFKGF